MDKISDIKGRILTFLKKKGIKLADFCVKTGLQESNFKGRNKESSPGGDMLVKILTAYPELSARWLVIGKGEMLGGNSYGETYQKLQEKEHHVSDDTINGQQTLPTATYTDIPGEGIPLLPIDAMAGALTGEISILEYECERYVVPAFKGADFLIPVKGSSMYPKYSSGDIVACKRVPMDGIFFQWNKVYVIDTDQGALIKRIKPGSDKEHVLIVSDNEKYDSFELHYSAIHAIALVIGVIRLE